jgi:hypothetical protein
MNGFDACLRLPTDLTVWLLLVYMFLVLAGARIVELLARSHFERAQRLAEGNFRYNPQLDHYDCAQGERLTLHQVDAERTVAVYRAKASSCSSCPLKASCTPHTEGRRVYRPLAVWAETEVGRFHQRASLFMVASAAAVSLGSFVCWAGRPGSGLLLAAFLVAFILVLRDVGSRDRSRFSCDTKEALVELLRLRTERD